MRRLVCQFCICSFCKTKIDKDERQSNLWCIFKAVGRSLRESTLLLDWRSLCAQDYSQRGYLGRSLENSEDFDWGSFTNTAVSHFC